MLARVPIRSAIVASENSSVRSAGKQLVPVVRSVQQSLVNSAALIAYSRATVVRAVSTSTAIKKGWNVYTRVQHQELYAKILVKDHQSVVGRLIKTKAKPNRYSCCYSTK